MDGYRAANIFRHLGRQLHDQRDTSKRPPTSGTLRLQVRAEDDVGPRNGLEIDQKTRQ